MKINFLFLVPLLCALFTSCEKEETEIDTQKPSIEMSFMEAFPNNCDTLYFGEPFTFKALFTDNQELGSYSIDFHNNFDQHSHTTETNNCEEEEIKEAVNPYVNILDGEIPAGSKSYTTNLSFTIPESNENGLFQPGDYHFFISLTDKEGWSTQKGISIKILHRP